jgi:hypothetical protein
MGAMEHNDPPEAMREAKRFWRAEDGLASVGSDAKSAVLTGSVRITAQTF